MISFRNQRKARNRLKFSEIGKRSQQVQRERRIAQIDPLELSDLLNVPSEGDIIGSLEYRCFRTGVIKRWTILRGDRTDRVMLRGSDGRQTKPHGWSWVMSHLRGYLAGRKY